MNVIEIRISPFLILSPGLLVFSWTQLLWDPRIWRIDLRPIDDDDDDDDNNNNNNNNSNSNNNSSNNSSNNKTTNQQKLTVEGSKHPHPASFAPVESIYFGLRSVLVEPPLSDKSSEGLSWPTCEVMLRQHALVVERPLESCIRHTATTV